MLNFIIQNRIKQLAANNLRKPVFKSLDQVNSVLVLYEISEQEEAIAFIQQLHESGKQVKSCVYIPKKNKKTPYAGSFRIDAAKDINLIKIPSDRILKELGKIHPDLIVDLSLRKNLSLEYLILSIPSGFRVGLRKDDYPVYDLSISIPYGGMPSDFSVSIDFLGTQLLHYLQVIQGNQE